MPLKILFHIRLSVLIFSFLSISCNLLPQDTPMAAELCTNPKIHTVLFYRTGWEMSMPVIFFGEDESLEFRFDYLDKPEIDFGYSIANCDYNWQINDIPESYFLAGFNDIALNNYQPSRNTTRYFTHYSLVLPNEDIKLLKSGNYLLQVYNGDDPSEIILARRFCIAEKAAEINTIVRRPDDQNQELSIQIAVGRLKSTDPIHEVKVAIYKNYNWNDPVTISSPPSLRNNTLCFDMPYQVLTPGGSEYRYFDTKNTKFESERVDRIEYRPPEFYFILKPDKLRSYSPYFLSDDLNGRFFVEIPDANDRHLESDYVNVQFTLECPQPFGTDVYIYGALTGWTANESNYMVYNPDRQAYEKTLLLKQGYYNYLYATGEYGKGALNFDLTEGSHSETENDYLIFVYLSRPMDDIDRLVGYTVVNSTGKVK
jgi:hypothetical protein